MTSIQSAQKVSWWLTILTIGTYLCWLVFAGHGAIPMGLLLVWGLEYWSVPIIFGWLGLILIITGRLLNRFEAISLIGMVFIIISWGIILWWSEEILTNIFTSIPFLICIFFLSRKFLIDNENL